MPKSFRLMWKSIKKRIFDRNRSLASESTPSLPSTTDISNSVSSESGCVQNPTLEATQKYDPQQDHTDNKPLNLMEEENVINLGSYIINSGKRFDEFLEIYKDSILTDGNNCRYSLTLESEFFYEINYQRFLSTCLVDYGHGLQEFSLEIPRNVASLPFLFPAFELQNLEKLTVNFTNNHINYDGHEPESSVSATYFVQTLLNSATNIQEFTLDDQAVYIPPNFEYLSLPSSLQHVRLLSDTLKPVHLQILLRTRLPNLTTLLLPDISYPGNLWLRIMEQFKCTLLFLEIHGNCKYYNAPERCISFPKMEKLMGFVLTSSRLCLKPEIGNLMHLLPKLMTLGLSGHTKEMLSYWIDDSEVINSVQFLSLGSTYYPIRLTAELMQICHLAFTNLFELDLTIKGDVTEGLKYIFEDMNQIKHLGLNLQLCHETKTVDSWDELLTGIPKESQSEESYESGYCNETDEEDEDLENEVASNITMLRELRYLSLITNDCGDPNHKKKPSLISDFTFIKALMKMPTLEILALRGRFRASKHIAQLWMHQGKKIYTKGVRQS